MALRILVIEDSPAILEMIRYLLRAFGHTPLLAVEGLEGLQAAERELPDLILCDIQLPVMDGYEIVRRLKSDPRLTHIPVVALTALAMVGDRDRVLAAGFDGYMAKPIVPQTFVSEVEAFSRFPSETPTGPVLQQPPVAKTPSMPAKKSLESPYATILAVDNFEANLAFAKAIFEPAGYRVLLARNVDDALALTKEHRPDLVLCDLHMPGKNGHAFIRLVRADAQFKTLPIIVISASIYPERDAKTSRDLGATKHLQRPVDPELLLTEVASSLALRRARTFE